ncbi:MAG: class I SAM-dependent methyltransferase [Actinomycetota bacterium]
MGLLRWLSERADRGGGSTLRDTGEAPPQVISAADEMAPGRALDLGCGTGTNVLSLALRGWSATGVDRSSQAVESARRKADWVSGATFVEGDVTRLSELGVDGPFDLVLDVGCFEGIPAERRDAYVQEVSRVARPGGRFLLFASGPRSRWPGSRRTREPEVRDRFGRTFDLTTVEPGREPRSAWFTLTRRPG